MNGSEYKIQIGSWILTHTMPSDEEEWKRLKSSEAIIRYEFEERAATPAYSYEKRIKRLEEKGEQITFLDLVADEEVKREKAGKSDSQYLDILLDLASGYSPWVIAKYVGLPDYVDESASAHLVNGPGLASGKNMAETDALMYRTLREGIEFELQHSMTYKPLVDAVFLGYSGGKAWLNTAEKSFKSFLEQEKNRLVMACRPSLIAAVFKDMEQINLSFRDALLIFSDSTLYRPDDTEWRRVRAEIKTPEQCHRLIEASIWTLGGDLFEDLMKIVLRFSDREEDNQYFSIGQHGRNWEKKLGDRIDKDSVLNRRIKRDEDRAIYALKRGGYSHPEIRPYASIIAGKSLTDDNVRQRYSRISRDLKNS